MLKNYLKITTRNIFRQPTYTILNLCCLSLGIAAALVILLYLDFELTYDQFHQKADRIYRIETKAIRTHEKVIDVNWETTSGPFGPYLKQDFPEVENYTRFYQFFRNSSVALRVADKEISVNQLMVADASLFDIFSFEFIYGDSKNSLSAPNQIVLSESLAKGIFGNTNPVGAFIETELVHILPDVNPNYRLVVTGVYKDLPNNSHIPSEAFIAAQTDPKLADYEIGRFSFYTYALLREGVSSEQLTEKLPIIYEKYVDAQRDPVLKAAIHELVALPQIHLRETGGATYLYIFGAVGFLLLLIAIISYVNLVTAQASKRALEIGIRKVLGSERRQLVLQFLLESLAFSSLALVIGLLIVFLAIAPLNVLLNLQLSTQQLLHPTILLGAIGIILLVGLLGGSYPAFFLSGFQPIAVMKGKMAKGTPLRKMLVAVQFTVVMMVLVSTGMIYEQLQFLRQKDLGFNRSEIIQLHFANEKDQQKLATLKAAFLQNPLIKNISSSGFLPGVGMGRRPLSADNGTSRESQFVHFGNIDYDFLVTMDIELKAGRNFSENFPSDADENIIVNEAMVKSFGLSNPIGEKVRYGDKNNPNFKRIIGVVEDFHQSSLHQAIAPQLFLLAPENYNILVKVDQNITEAIAHLEQSWKSIFPNADFNFQFLDDTLQQSYETDQIRGKLFLLLTFLTVFITFLGFFGLVAYVVQQRVKEIGIRKVLGANIGQIVFLVSKDFVWLVLLAALPAFLVAYFFIENWLQDFAFQTSFNPILPALVLLGALFFTFCITSLHASRIAQLNPSETLKNVGS